MSDTDVFSNGDKMLLVYTKKMRFWNWGALICSAAIGSSLVPVFRDRDIVSAILSCIPFVIILVGCHLRSVHFSKQIESALNEMKVNLQAYNDKLLVDMGFNG